MQLRFLWILGAVAALLPLARLLLLGGWQALLPLLLFSPLFVLTGLQVFFVWYLYERFAHRSTVPAPPPGATVDVYVTAYDEPEWLVRRTLKSAVEIRHPHETYLLDDGDDPVRVALCRELGAKYLRRETRKDHKAGNVNAALGRTAGEFIAIFDADHAPRPDFLDRTLGHFRDSQVGFVQAMITFSNHDETLVSEASAQTSYDYYNLLAVAKDREGAAGLMGSNAVIRRDALRSIGGYRPGLAEDLETSLALHGIGWRSAYVCEPLAPGSAPVDLPGFFTQQTKWARGVLEAAFFTFPRVMSRLTRRQRLCYALRFTNYLMVPVPFLHMVVLVPALASGWIGLESYLRSLVPFAASVVLVRCFALRRWATDPVARMGFCWKGTSLVASAWPAYLRAIFATMLRAPIAFVPTPKIRDDRGRLFLYVPQLAMVCVLSAAALWRLAHGGLQTMPATVAWAIFFIALHWVPLACLVRELPAVARTPVRAPAPEGDLPGG